MQGKFRFFHTFQHLDCIRLFVWPTKLLVLSLNEHTFTEISSADTITSCYRHVIAVLPSPTLTYPFAFLHTLLYLLLIPPLLSFGKGQEETEHDMKCSESCILKEIELTGGKVSI